MVLDLEKNKNSAFLERGISGINSIAAPIQGIWKVIFFSMFFLSLFRIMKKVVGNRSGCPTQGDKVVELIYIDIVGLTQFKKTLGPSWVHYQ